MSAKRKTTVAGVFLLAIWAPACLAISLQGLGGLHFNAGKVADPQGDYRSAVSEKIDHLEQMFLADPAGSVTIGALSFAEGNSTLSVEKIATLPQTCQVTICKIGKNVKLMDVNLVTRRVRVLKGEVSSNLFGEGCFELTQYSHKKLKIDPKIDPLFTKAFISGTLSSYKNQAQLFKILLLKALQPYLKNIGLQTKEDCTLKLLEGFLRTELASFSQTYLQNNFENRIKMKIATSQAKLEAAKKRDKDLQKVLDTIISKEVHAVVLNTPINTIGVSCDTKVFNVKLSKRIEREAKVCLFYQILKQGQLKTFSEYWNDSGNHPKAVKSLVFIKRDRVFISLLILTLEFPTTKKKDQAIQVLSIYLDNH